MNVVHNCKLPWIAKLRNCKGSDVGHEKKRAALLRTVLPWLVRAASSCDRNHHVSRRSHLWLRWGNVQIESKNFYGLLLQTSCTPTDKNHGINLL